jgi:ribosomal-protein-alanine N-acetyltransferase
MNKNNFPEIHTERLVLKRLEKSDWKVISFLRSDKNVNQFVNIPAAETKEKALKYIDKINTGVDKQNIYYWKITERNKNEMIGSICLWNFSKDDKTAEIGYVLSPEYHRKGIMNESLKNVTKFGFQKLNLNLIVAYTHYLNKSSIKLLKRNGYNLVKGKKDEDYPDNIVFELKRPAVYKV